MYKCVTNGQVTYANEPCKGQTMQVVKGNDTNMVQVNTPKVPIGTEGSASDLPVVKLQPKIDTSVGEAANLGLGAAAPANKNTDGGSANERFLKQLQAQTQALAQQQAQLTGSLEPLVGALKNAQQRIERAAQPRLAPVQRAIGRDLERIGSASVADTSGLLSRLDELVRQVDELPLANAVALAASTRRLQAQPADPEADTSGQDAWWVWLQRVGQVVFDEAKGLVRLSRIDQPEAALLAPDQAFFLRENLKLKLLNARMGVLARLLDSARTDLTAATAALNRYFDPASRRTQSAATVLQQVQASMKVAELPRPDETLSALATAAAGR